jgi:hypothetical protein
MNRSARVLIPAALLAALICTVPTVLADDSLDAEANNR